jgi:hypothetical protein
VLAERMDWSQFDAAIDACYAEELGRPGVNTRLMVGLLYLKHAFDESNESVEPPGRIRLRIDLVRSLQLSNPA